MRLGDGRLRSFDTIEIYEELKELSARLENEKKKIAITALKSVLRFWLRSSIV